MGHIKLFKRSAVNHWVKIAIFKSDTCGQQQPYAIHQKLQTTHHVLSRMTTPPCHWDCQAALALEKTPSPDQGDPPNLPGLLIIPTKNQTDKQIDTDSSSLMNFMSLPSYKWIQLLYTCPALGSNLPKYQ